MKVANARKRNLAYVLLAVVAVGLTLIYVKAFTGFAMTGSKEWSWVGALQSNSAEFRVRAPNGAKRQFVVSTGSDFNDKTKWVFNQSFTFDEDFQVLPASFSALSPSQKYHYGNIDAVSGSTLFQGTFQTPKPEGTRMNFRVATAGCALTGSKSSVFTKIGEFNPLMMIHAGDMHYSDIKESDTMNERINAFDRVLASPTMGSLYSSVALGYIWDDHDYCGNNMNALCPGKVTARKSYQKGFPHYPLKGIPAFNLTENGEPQDVPIFQSFTIGAIRFVLTDLRSEAQMSNSSSNGSIMSPEQKAFLFNEFENAKNYDFMVWISSKPWIGSAEVGGDSWQGWAADRKEISTYIGNTIGKEKKNLFVVSSDAHMLAFDDGHNTDYSENSTLIAGFPILQSGPLHNIGSLKGGPFTEGCFTHKMEMNNQFSILDFSEEEGTGKPCISYNSYKLSHSGSLIDVFSGKLCGEIMKSGDPINNPMGTCNPSPLSTSSIIVIVFVVVFLAIFSLIAFIMFVKPLAWKLVGIMFAFVIVQVVLGLGVPVAVYYSTRTLSVETFWVSLLAMIQCLFGLAFLAFTVFNERKRNGVISEKV